MEVRNKHEVAKEIEMAREELPQAWEMVHERNPITLAARAGKAAVSRWKVRSREKSRAADRKLRTTPYPYIAGAILLGAVAGVIFSTMRRRRLQIRVN